VPCALWCHDDWRLQQRAWEVLECIGGPEIEHKLSEYRKWRSQHTWRDGTPLDELAFFDAISKGNIATLRDLLDRGFDPNTKAKDGKTAIELAMTRKLSDIVKLLKGAGARQ
jgi:hypothetical protein